MPKIEPTFVNAALKTALKDGEVTADEVKNNIAPAALKDLARSDNPKETLRLAAENLARFLEPFRTNDSQEEKGVLLARTARYSLTDLAETLSKSAEQLDAIKGGVFGAAFGLAIEDGQVSVTEVKHLQTAAKKMMESATDPAAAARTMRGMLLEVEAMLAQTALFGSATREEVFSADSSKALGKLNKLLGTAIASGLSTGTEEKVDPNGTFAKGIKDIVEADGMGRGLVMAALPSLIDQEVAMFNADGLVGPAKLKMEQQAEKRASALMSYVDSLPASSGSDDVKFTLFRLVTGKYVPPAAADQFKAELTSVDVDELKGAIKGLTKELESGTGSSFTAVNQRKAIADGIALIQAEIERR
jgi:hypothetical protein